MGLLDKLIGRCTQAAGGVFGDSPTRREGVQRAKGGQADERAEVPEK